MPSLESIKPEYAPSLKVGDKLEITSFSVQTIEYQNKDTEVATIQTKNLGERSTFSEVIIDILRNSEGKFSEEDPLVCEVTQPNGKRYLTLK
ncbi:hypothetical protein [Nitrosopumilus spindle-shaped virus]|uniref:Uncharacterized protein n=1 Tax=Nitrosopumilus spindle-shaped virus TaxID=2508184 RepID=A0A514K335_9VIRU|nr:hypothetical protein [Nitrosopumilus spindle-shaped virus]